MAWTATLLLCGIAGFLVYESWPAIGEIGLLRFFTDENWYPTLNSFAIWPMIGASLAVAGGALLISAPLSIGGALLMVFAAPDWLRNAYSRCIEVLAAIPSVIYGFWGLLVLVPFLQRLSPLQQGHSLLAGMLILALMTLPTAALVAYSSLHGYSRELLHGALALGLSKPAAAWKVMLPAARGAVSVALLLQLARALGETIAVLMVCGNVVQFSGSLFEPVRTLTANIALEMGYATALHRSSLFLTGLVLMLVVSLLMALAASIRRWHEYV